MSSMKRRMAAAAIAALCSSGGSARADSVADFYTGKQITLIISTGVGGGLDANARLVARHMGKHIPGKPTIVARNMPGAGHIQATNFMFNQAPKDGSHIAAILPSFVLYQLIDGRGAQYDAQKLNWLGSSDVDNMNVYVWHTAPAQTVEDAKKTEILMGSTGAGSYTILFPTLMNRLLGTRFNTVSGYKSTNEIHLAMERGEVHGRAGNFFSSLKSQNADWLREGKITLLAQIGEERDTEFSTIPLLQELTEDQQARQIIRLFSAEIAMGKAYLTAPEVPMQRLDGLRRAFDATMMDSAFIGEAKAAGIDVRPLKADAVSRIANEILATPKELVERAAEVRGKQK